MASTMGNPSRVTGRNPAHERCRFAAPRRGTNRHARLALARDPGDRGSIIEARFLFCSPGDDSAVVALEQDDLMSFKAQTLGDGAADHPSADHDDPRHIRKIGSAREEA
jgi:hypothetical protein